MSNDRLKFRTPYYLPGPDGKDEFVNFCHWNAIDGRPGMMVTWGPDEQCTGKKDKNGTLIYDGDVVIKKDSNALGYGRTRKCRVHWDERYAGWTLTTEFGDTYRLSEFAPEQLEIVAHHRMGDLI